MTGMGLLGLVLLSMAWLLFLGAAAWRVWPLAAIAGSVAVFFTVPALARLGFALPWPWLWILLPLLLAFKRR
jgi:hypothetical protein